jgi:hypothetical protein
MFVDGLNRYAYCGNDPINYLDSMGLDSYMLGTLLRNAGFPGAGEFTDDFADGAREIVNPSSMGGAAASVAASMVPIAGETLDVAILTSPDSSGFDRTAAGVSLGLNVVTAGLLPNFGGIVKAAKAVDDVSEVRERMRLVRATGMEGERLAGITKAKEAIEINGRTRFADELIRYLHIKEVKNVARLSFTQQLRDYLDYAKANQLRFILVMRRTTIPSGPLKDAMDRGDIVPNFLEDMTECAKKSSGNAGS